MFADDLKLYGVYLGKDSTPDLQESINRLVSWSAKWQLKININKCHTLSLSKRKSSRNMSSKYSLDGVDLPNVSSINDLGITITSDFSFKRHISNIITKSFQRAGVFFRGFVSRRLDIARKTFVTYIRPILEYNSSVWNPTITYLIDKIENVQRRFTKRINSISHLSYLERLSILGLEPL